MRTSAAPPGAWNQLFTTNKRAASLRSFSALLWLGRIRGFRDHMGWVRGHGRAIRCARLAVLGAACLALGNCSNGKFGSVDPKYGVSASARVVEPGQPVPKGGGVYRVGKPYVVGGRVYTPEENINYSATGMASWYGDDFHGRYTANGEIFDMNSISAAHPTLPMPSYVRVTNLKNRKSIVVRVNDRGPYANDRIIDLSVRTAKLLGFYGHGLARVKVEYVGRAPIAGSDDRKLLATLRDGDTQSKVQLASAGDYAPVLFDPRSLRQAAPLRNVPSPPERPYAEDGSPQTEEIAAETAPPRPLFDKPVQRYALEAPAAEPQPMRLTSPVSAYAPVRYDAAAGFMGGRGLY
jgi:rare lipoprotein A